MSKGAPISEEFVKILTMETVTNPTVILLHINEVKRMIKLITCHSSYHLISKYGPTLLLNFIRDYDILILLLDAGADINSQIQLPNSRIFNFVVCNNLIT